MEFLILWLIFGAITSKIASDKGNDPIRGFFLGLLLGPLGLLIALLSSKDDSELKRSALKSGNKKKCQFCAELIASEAIKCKHCGEIQSDIKPENLNEVELNALIAKLKNK